MDRQLILDRIRQALSTPTSQHVKHVRDDVASIDLKRALPAGGDSLDERIKLFAGWCEKLRTTLIVVENDSQIPAALREIVTNKKVAAQRAGIVETSLRGLGVEPLWIDGSHTVAGLEACDVGITDCVALIAQTGSIVVSSAHTAGRAISVLPPHHVVLARVDQLLPDTVDAYAKVAEIRKQTPASMISFITGPSRTGDIERILVLGAHGPERLTVILSRSQN